jgi:membrane protein YqaA with SNARE-associated domain
MAVFAMLRRSYDWLMKLAAHRHAQWYLAAVSFVESSVFPVPPDAMLIPMTLAKPSAAWRYASVCTIASVLGGLLGYAIGIFLFETLGQWILDFYGLGEKFVDFQMMFNDWGLPIVFVAGLTPFPYKIITLLSGVTEMALPTFIAASIVSRGIRFYLVCGLLYWLGEPMRMFIEKYLGWITIAASIALVGGFAAARYLT